MANLGQTFDSNTVEPAVPFEVVPTGKYPVHIVNSEMKETKGGDGKFLWMELEILDGQHKGRKLFDRLNLINSNQQAVEIAQRTLSAICQATGQVQISDSQQLHGRAMLASVRVRPAGPDKNGIMRDAQNEIRGYEPAGGMAATARPAFTVPGAQNSTNSTNSANSVKPAAQQRPWARSA